MKTSDSLIGGRLIDDPKIYSSYALYLLKFVQAYRPRECTSTSSACRTSRRTVRRHLPGTDMPSVQEEKVISDLGPCCAPPGCPQDPRL